MRAQVIFRWGKSQKGPFHGEGTTRDVGLAGAYVFTGTCPPINEKVQLEIILPPLFTGSSTRVRAEMKVLRVEQGSGSEGRGGFSVFGKGFSLRPGSKEPSSPISGFLNGNEGRN